MNKVVDALARYIGILSHCAEKTSIANDRPTYQQHLAAAAVMLAGIREDPSLAKLRSQVAEERRAYGWGHLSGDLGSEAERAFDEFVTSIESV